MKKRHYTILELLIVMAILTLIAGVVGYNVRGSIQEQNFRNEVKFIVDELRVAQDLMLILSSDVHVKFEKNSDNTIKYWIETEEKLTERWQPFLQRSKKNLTAIRHISFQEIPSNQLLTDHIDLKFLSSGSVMTHGILTLSNNEKPNDLAANTRTICLYGYPHPISSSTIEKKFCSKQDEANYSKKLTETTIKEINEHAQNKTVQEETPAST